MLEDPLRDFCVALRTLEKIGDKHDSLQKRSVVRELYLLYHKYILCQLMLQSLL